MRRPPFFRRTFRITRHRSDVPRDVRDEIDAHLEMRAQELVDEGLSPADARAAALAAFGDRGRIEAECRRFAEPLDRARRRRDLAGSFFGDVRHALRDMARRPGFALVAGLTLALCIALNAAVFSIVYGVVLKPLPYRDSDLVVYLYNSYPEAGAPRSRSSPPDYFDRREGVGAFEEVALYSLESRTLGNGDARRWAFSMQVTPSFFRVLGVEPALGRAFTEDEGEPGNESKVILGHHLWQELFGGEEAAVGRELRVEGVPHTVVGVLPEDFRFPGWDAEVWVPLAFGPRARSDAARHSNNLDMIARLAPGATVEQAREQVDALNAAVTDRLPAQMREMVVASGFHTEVLRLRDELVRDVRSWLYLLWGGAVFVLLIGCISVSNLLLVRSTGRLRELATRYLLGASRWRLGRQLMTESAVLALAGGALGLLGAGWSLRLLGVFEAYEVPRLADVRLDPPAAVLGLALAVAATVVSSLLSTVMIHRRDLFAALQAGGITATSGRGVLSLRGALVAAQIAVACVLLVGTGLTVASLRNVLAVEPGFETDDLLVGAFVTPGARYPTPADRHRFLDALRDEIRALPGAVDAAVASQLPFSGQEGQGPVTPESGWTPPSGESVVAHYRTFVSPSYFTTMGLPLLEGRGFHDGDDAGAAAVAVVSERVARRYWPGRSPVGQRLSLSNDGVEWRTVVGVVGDVVQNDLTVAAPSQGAVYAPLRQVPLGFFRLVVKTEVPPLTLLAAVRERIRALDPEMTLFWTGTMEESVAGTLLDRRLPIQLLSLFAALALVLAAVGVYGVLAQSVQQGTREIGIRMVLGSRRAGIYRAVLRRSFVMVAAGVAAGLAAALALSRLLEGFLYQVRPTDPTVFALVVAVISLVAGAACLAPARRATRVDPAAALKSE